jgi:hypothetical protein
MRLSSRLTVAMVALVLLATTAVGVLTYLNITASALPRALERLDRHAGLLGNEIAAAAGIARADVTSFRSSTSVIDIMTAHISSASDPATKAEWRRRLGLRFAAELDSKLNYYEFRFIGVEDGGREIVRADRWGPNGSVRVVPDSELQQKGDSEYFKETIRLPSGAVHVSPIVLNEDHGVIETPRSR